MVRKLTKKTEDGKPYVRPDSITKSIEQALSQDLSTICSRTAATIKEDRLPPEVLVYLIRNALRGGEPDVYNALLPILLSQCEATLNNKVYLSKWYDAIALREEILGQFSELFALDGTLIQKPHKKAGRIHDELDAYETCFNLAFMTFYIDAVRKAQKSARRNTELPEEIDDSDDEVAKPLPDNWGLPPKQVDELLRQRLLEAIDTLPEKQREVVGLRYLGYTEEEIAKRCGVTVKTVYNRLQRARMRLMLLKEEVT